MEDSDIRATHTHTHTAFESKLKNCACMMHTRLSWFYIKDPDSEDSILVISVVELVRARAWSVSLVDLGAGAESFGHLGVLCVCVCVVCVCERFVCVCVWVSVCTGRSGGRRRILQASRSPVCVCVCVCVLCVRERFLCVRERFVCVCMRVYFR
jgi:hypothetical protein